MADREVRIQILGDSRDFQKAVKDATRSGDDLESGLSRAGKGAALAIGGVALAGAGLAVAFGPQLIDLGNKVATWRTKVATVFGSSAEDVRKWADDSNEAMGLTDDELAGLAAGFGDLLVPMGFTREAAAKMSKETINLSGALSAWSGGQRSAAEVSNILAKAMLGERDGLKELGISISEADVQGRLLQKGQDQLTGAALEQAKALATQELIMEKSTDAQKAWADGTFDAQKKQNELKAKVAELKEDLAGKLLPAFTAVAGYMVDTVIPAFERLAAWVQVHWPEIRDTITGAVQAIKDFVTPIIEGLQAFWRTFGDNILEFVKGAWGGIRDAIEGTLQVIEGIVDVFVGIFTLDWDRAWAGIKGIVSGVWDAINGIIDQALAAIKLVVESGLTVLAGILDGAWGGIKGAASAALDGLVGFFRDLPGNIVSALGDIVSKMVELGKSIIRGIIDGLKAVGSEIKDWIFSFIPSPGDVLDAITGGGPSVLEMRARELRGEDPMTGEPVERRAGGGMVNPFQTYLVGERGPELFRPSLAGAIIPNASLSGGRGPTIGTVNVYTLGDGDAIARAVTDQWHTLELLYG